MIGSNEWKEGSPTDATVYKLREIKEQDGVDFANSLMRVEKHKEEHSQKALSVGTKFSCAFGNALLCVSSSAVRQRAEVDSRFAVPGSGISILAPHPCNPAEPCFSSKFLRRRGWYSINCSRQGLGQGSRRGYPREVEVSFCIRVHLRASAVLFFFFGCPFGRLRALSGVEGRLRCARQSVVSLFRSAFQFGCQFGGSSRRAGSPQAGSDS